MNGSNFGQSDKSRDYSSHSKARHFNSETMLPDLAICSQFGNFLFKIANNFFSGYLAIFATFLVL